MMIESIRGAIIREKINIFAIKKIPPLALNSESWEIIKRNFLPSEITCVCMCDEKRARKKFPFLYFCLIDSIIDISFISCFFSLSLPPLNHPHPSSTLSSPLFEGKKNVVFVNSIIFNFFSLVSCIKLLNIHLSLSLSLQLNEIWKSTNRGEWIGNYGWICGEQFEEGFYAFLLNLKINFRKIHLRGFSFFGSERVRWKAKLFAVLFGGLQIDNNSRNNKKTPKYSLNPNYVNIKCEIWIWMNLWHSMGFFPC